MRVCVCVYVSMFMYPCLCYVLCVYRWTKYFGVTKASNHKKKNEDTMKVSCSVFGEMLWFVCALFLVSTTYKGGAFLIIAVWWRIFIDEDYLLLLLLYDILLTWLLLLLLLWLLVGIKLINDFLVAGVS